MTHDYKRHGTTTLFAALDVLTGTVIGSVPAAASPSRIPHVLAVPSTAKYPRI